MATESNESLTADVESVALISRMLSAVKPDSESLDGWASGYGRTHLTRLAYDLDLIKKHVPLSQSILEIGSVPLFLTGALKELGYDVSGVDIDPARFSRAMQSMGLKVHAANVETDGLPVADSSVDCVIFNEIFEHLRINLIRTTRELIRVLKPGGLLFISTPNLRCATNIYSLVARGFVLHIHGQYEKLETIGHMGHVRLYTAREVAYFLHEMGMKVESIVYRGAYSARLWKRLAWNIAPSFKPMFSVIARKPGTSP
jgi:SAM-dependent methyltransferase